MLLGSMEVPNPPTHQTKLPGSGNSSSSNIRPFSHDLSDNVLSTMQVKAAAVAALGKPATYTVSLSRPLLQACLASL
jgi:hypothetical protein